MMRECTDKTFEEKKNEEEKESQAMSQIFGTIFVYDFKPNEKTSRAKRVDRIEI